jgi:pyrroloquinoline quinone (PQQ) biosynthesis protein C
MAFYDEMREVVLGHGAINNPFLDRFRDGRVTEQEFRDFAVEFYNFARFFPKILMAQLINTEDEAVADELTKVLVSELGDGRPKNRHELLYRDFLRSIGIDVHEAMTRPMMPSTRAYIEGMERLYSDGNHDVALGASFGLENMAITMWDHLIPGLRLVKSQRCPAMDLTYFTFHRDLEATHEDAMKQAVTSLASGGGAAEPSLQTRLDFRRGMEAVLDYLEGFWRGLDRSADRPTISSAA